MSIALLSKIRQLAKDLHHRIGLTRSGGFGQSRARLVLGINIRHAHMVMLELDQLPSLDDQQKSALRRAGLITPSEVLLVSPHDLGKRLRISDQDSVQAIIRAVSRGIVPSSHTVAELVERDRTRWIGTGDGDIDGMLGGGLRRGCITEIAGESASGKSHLGLQLAVNSQLSTYSPTPGGTILLTSERKVSFTRLEELAQHSLRMARSLPSSSFSTLPPNAKSMLDNIQTMHVTEVDGLEHALAYALPAMINQIAVKAGKQQTNNKLPIGSRALPVKLIVIDSIGALFRASFDSNMSGLSQRSKMLCLISDKLKILAEDYDLAVLVINQVSDVFGRGLAGLGPGQQGRSGSAEAGHGGSRATSPSLAMYDEPTMTYKMQSRYFSGQSDILAKEASLGLVWANAVNVRIMLSRTGRRRAIDHSDISNKRKKISAYDKEVQEEVREERRVVAAKKGEAVQPLSQEGEEAWESTLIRRMHLVFSPFAPEATLDYVILQSGVHSLTAPQNQKVIPERSVTGGDVDQSGDHDKAPADDDFGDLPPDWWKLEEMTDGQS